MNYLEKTERLPLPLKDFLLSDNPRYEIERVSFMYELAAEEIGVLSQPIALIFVGELKLKDYPATIAKNLNKSKEVIYSLSYEINRRIFFQFADYFQDAKQLLDFWGRNRIAPVISEDAAWQKVLELEPEILEREQEEREEKNEKEETKREQLAQIDSLPIEAAMKKYPEVGEQLITERHIKLKTFPEPVRPSVKNWISDYMFNVGITNHDPIVRGNYLFRSTNGQTLSYEEREKLSLILKSFEEKTPLEINSKLKIVLFPAIVRKTEPAGNSLPSSQFKSPQSEPRDIYEKTQLSTAPVSRLANPAPIPSAPKPRGQFFQNDSERLSAWRQDIPSASQSQPNIPRAPRPSQTVEEDNFHFSSPQKFSTEKDDQTLTSRPAKHTNLDSWQNSVVNKPARPLPKNVVNLKENN